MIVGIHHVAIGVDDFDKALTFYTEALGFEVSATSQDFKANIPVATDLVNMNESIAQVMEKAKAVCK